MRAGDILVLVNGEYVVIEKVQHEILEAPVTVYNFRVEDYHTYYVANAGILVHNNCPGLDNKRLLNNKTIGRYKVSMDLERGASGINIHIHVGSGPHSKYVYDGISDFINDVGDSIYSKILESELVQSKLAHALELIGKGW